MNHKNDVSQHLPRETIGDLLKFIAPALKEARASLGLSIDQLAEKSGTSYIFCSHLERGICKGLQLGKLSQVCGALGLELILSTQIKPDALK